MDSLAMPKESTASKCGVHGASAPLWSSFVDSTVGAPLRGVPCILSVVCCVLFDGQMRIPVIAALGLLACEGSYAFRRPVSEQTGKAFVSLVEVASLAHHYALSENAVGAKGGDWPDMTTSVSAWIGRRSVLRMGLISEIQEALVKRHEVPQIARVLDSLDNVAMGKELAENHEAHGGARQEASSFIEGLTAQPWYDASQFAWCSRLEESADIIKEELQSALTPEGSEALKQRGTNIWVHAVEEAALSYGPDWKTLVLQDREWDAANCRLFPRTAEILRKVTADKDAIVPSVEAFFARQAPGTGIKPHTDFCNFILTAHLGLEIPAGDCWIKVGNEARGWENGKCMLFDTSFIHSTANNTDKDRYVLLLRTWHPELSQDEREALSFVFKATSDPTILEKKTKPASSSDLSGLSMKERKKRRQKAASAKKGFS